jgi:hypothetical protein
MLSYSLNLIEGGENQYRNSGRGNKGYYFPIQKGSNKRKMIHTSKLITFLIVIFLSFFVNAEKLQVLEEVFKGPFIRMDDNQIYIYDIASCKFYIYSKDNFNKISEFGSKGEGPGEFRTINYVQISARTICVSNFPKISFFSKDGKLIKELKTPTNVSYFIPVEKNFLGATNLNLVENREKDSIVFSLFDANLKKIKVLYKAEFAKYIKFQDCKLISRWFRDCTRAITYHDKIVIGSTDRGFFFTLFDSEGNKLYDINRKSGKRKVTDVEKEKRIEKAKEAMGETKWKSFKGGTEISFPEYYPAYMNFEVDDEKLYVFDFPEKGNQGILILDFHGKLLKRVTIPIIDIPGYIEHTCFCIHKGKIYFMIENEEIQKWEIHYKILE